MRIVSKNYPVHGEEAIEIAEATFCAMDQGRFWDYSDRLFERLYAGTPIYGTEALKRLAADLKLDATVFSSCVDGGKYRQRVEDEAAEAQALGVNSTPTFFVNDTKLVGARPFEAFKAAIEAELKEK